MSLEHLWAGWRSTYVQGVAVGNAPEHPGGEGGPGHGLDEPRDESTPCVFCRLMASGRPSVGNGVVKVGQRCAALLNAYPYAPGHLMVMPIRHVGSLGALGVDEHAELWSLLGEAVDVLERAYGPDGINVGANLGRAAGAGIPGHLHVHAVPRWVGDTNFMTAIAGVRVLPESLSESWGKVHGCWGGEAR